MATRRCLQWNKEKATTTSSHKLLPLLPAELIEFEILTRLHVISLLRFRSVCKAWRYLISSNTNFIKTHLLLNPNNYDSLMLKSNNCDYYDIESDSLLQKHSMIIGCINGLVCFYNRLKELDVIKVYIWNPATKQCKEITLLHMKSDERLHEHYFFGFGFDSIGDDYKVMYISIIQGQPLAGDLYSCKDGDCRRKIALSSFLYQGYLLNQSQCTIFNGSPYWLHLQSSRLIVISFDIPREEFKLLPSSVDIKHSYTRGVLTNLEESLALLVYHRWLFLEGGVDVYIWSERCGGGVWNKSSSIRPFICQEPTISSCQILLQCFRNGDILYMDDDHKLYCLDPQTHTVKSLDKQARCWFCCNYTESLIFIEGMEPMYVNKDEVGISYLNKH